MQKVQNRFPIVAKKRRVVDDVEEECMCPCLISIVEDKLTDTPNTIDWDMAFPDDEREANPASFKFLEMAHKWKSAGGGAGLLAGLRGAHSNTEPPSAPREEAMNEINDDGSSGEEDD